MKCGLDCATPDTLPNTNNIAAERGYRQSRLLQWTLQRLTKQLPTSNIYIYIYIYLSIPHGCINLFFDFPPHWMQLFSNASTVLQQNLPGLPKPPFWDFFLICSLALGGRNRAAIAQRPTRFPSSLEYEVMQARCSLRGVRGENTQISSPNYDHHDLAPDRV